MTGISQDAKEMFAKGWKLALEHIRNKERAERYLSKPVRNQTGYNACWNRYEYEDTKGIASLGIDWGNEDPRGS